MTKQTKQGKEVLGVRAPKVTVSVNDKKCPFTGGLVVKNELLKGKVIKKDINHSATIEWQRSVYVPKYERYSTKRSRVRVHNPEAIDAQVGDFVVAARTRPLSKTKHHVIIEIQK